MAGSRRDIEVLSFGESLVDFLPQRRGTPLRDVDQFQKVVGGAPTNMALGLARLGVDAALLGKIGRDEFGEFVIDTLAAAGVDMRGVVQTEEAQTGLTFVTLDESGDRSFLFYRDPSADMLLRPDDVDPELVERAQFFQVGSNLLTQPGVREATEKALGAARDADCAISVDPNIRLHLWESPEQARDAVLAQIDEASVVKVNEEELELVAPDKTAEEAWRDLVRPLGVDIFVVTLADAGAELYSPAGRTRTSAPEVDVVDTTGAGDGFMSGFLAALAESLREDDDERWSDGLSELTLDELERALELGTWIGSTVCTELGATPPLPDLDDVPDRFAARLR